MLFLLHSLFFVLFKPAAVRVNHYIVIAGMTEYLGIHMTATITPEIKFTAIYAQRNLTAVAEDDSRDFSAPRAGSTCVFYNDHDMLN